VHFYSAPKSRVTGDAGRARTGASYVHVWGNRSLHDNR